MDLITTALKELERRHFHLNGKIQDRGYKQLPCYAELPGMSIEISIKNTAAPSAEVPARYHVMPNSSAYLTIPDIIGAFL